MYINDIWKIKSNIKYGKIKFNKNDIVVLLRRKNNGYPKNIKENTDYIVKSCDDDCIFIQEKKLFDDVKISNTWLYNDIKIDKTYMVPKNILRDFNINKVLNEKYK